ncbi:MAG: cytochrome C oxidase Cbb3 [Planctomycetota bacterium]|nr:MAG: cytochrome C oxidase Cbb3 [Planctomycetota bacterium]
MGGRLMANHGWNRFEVDGIAVEDAPMPGWWRRLFVMLLILCPFYFLYFHAGAPGRTEVERYERISFELTKQRFAEIGELQPDAATLIEYSAKPNWLKVGKMVFKTHCVSCHGRNGEGGVGPNLTDDAYKHVRSIEDIARVIAEGANNNAMPAWKDKLMPNEIVLVAAYVASLRGTNAAGGKAAEGSVPPPWSAPEPQAPSP